VTITTKRIKTAVLNPKSAFHHLYRGVDFWPPKNFRKHYRFRFYFLDLPIRWLLKGVLPQQWDRSHFETFFEEDVFIDKFFFEEELEPTTFVDVGAGDGIDMSNTFKLADRGVKGLAIEGSPVRFAQLSLTYEKYVDVKLIRTYVSPDSITDLITGAEIPSDFDVLNLDIDSYDFFVLESILKAFTPKLCVLEWNRAYPPSIFFTVDNNPNIHWTGSKFFMGASMLAFYDLLKKFNYKIIGVQGAALFATPMNRSSSWRELNPEEAWNQYINGPAKWIDTETKILSLNKADQLKFFAAELSQFEGQFSIG
jgi:hypothetical protein